MAKIILLTDETVLLEVVLSKERITIGRRPHNDILIDDVSVSGEHAVIVTSGEDAYLEDLDSTNGTRVNGQPVKKHFLQDGDVVEVATHRLVYHAVNKKPEQTLAGVPMLEVARGTNTGRRTVLSKPITTVGGGPEPCLLIVRRGSDYFLIPEAGSTRPKVNGQTVDRAGWRLQHKDVIQLPGAELFFLHHLADLVD